MSRQTSDIYEDAYLQSQEFFLDDGGEDLFLVDDFPFGKLAQTQLFHVILDALTAERGRGIEQADSIFSSAGLAEWAKRNCFDWQIKEQLSRFTSAPSQFDSSAEILTIYDVRNGGMIDTLLRVHEKLERNKRVLALSCEPRVYDVVKSVVADSRLYPKGIDGWNKHKANAIYGQLRLLYRTNREELATRIKSAVGGNANHVINYADNLFARFYKQAAKDYVRATSLIEQMRPKLIVAASDCHKFSRMFTLLAQRCGVRSLVIQHGATISPHGYVPLYADKFAAWGRLSADWMTERGVPREKVVITGQPRLDRLAELARTKRSAGLTASRKILVATNPIPDEQNTALVKIIAKGIRNFSFDSEIILKLHPGQSQLELFRRLCYQNQLNCRIETHGDLYQMISESDMVITTQSTVGIETLALGQDLIIVDFPGLQTAIPYDKYECIYKIANGAELAEALRLNLTDSDPWPAIRSKRDKFVADYLYRVDGRATERVSELALEMLAEN